MFRRLRLGSHDHELSSGGIFLLWLLPPDTLCRHCIILISRSVRVVCHYCSLTFSILSVHSYVRSRGPNDTSQTRGEPSQTCRTESQSCARCILFFPTSTRDIYYKIALTPLWRVPFIDSTTHTANAQITIYVLISTHRRQTNSIN